MLFNRIKASLLIATVAAATMAGAVVPAQAKGSCGIWCIISSLPPSPFTPNKPGGPGTKSPPKVPLKPINIR